MKLYEEILFLKHFFRGHWVVENVTSYYDPLVVPTAVIDRHFFWSNFDISSAGRFARERDVSRETREQLSEYLGIVLPEGTPDQRKLLRNAVDPRVGKQIYDSIPRQESLFSVGVSEEHQ